MPGPIHLIEIHETHPVEGGAARAKEGLREGFRGMGDDWHEKYLPGHFDEPAAAKYHYARRQPGYERRKIAAAKRGRAKYGGQRDLVFSGLSEETLERGAILHAQTDKVVVEMFGPHYLKFRPARGIDLVDEITRTINAEVDDLERTFDGRLERSLEGPANPKTTTIH